MREGKVKRLGSNAGHCLGWLGIWDVVKGLEKDWDWSG